MIAHKFFSVDFKPLKMQNMPLFAVREHDEVYHLEVDIKMKIFSFLRNALGPQIKAQELFLDRDMS